MFLFFRFNEYIRRNAKFFLLVIFVFLLFYYVKNVHENFTLKQTLSQTNNNYIFDDNYHIMKNDLQYAVVIDAGSSGSRVYIYVWPPHSGDSRQLLKIRVLRNELGKDVYHSITPGLSSCSNNPSNASEYLMPLLEFASKNIPAQKLKETPLYVLATAGMRLLEEDVQKAILDDLRQDIPKNFTFSFSPKHVEVISGKEEGIYSWIAINYLTGRFDHNSNRKPLVMIEHDQKRFQRKNTIGMIEMGGASVQIAFEIKSNNQFNQLKNKLSAKIFKNFISEFNLGYSDSDKSHQYRLFLISLLTFGANSARQNYVRFLINKLDSKQFLNSSLFIRETTLYDPCLPIDSSETINLKNDFPTKCLYHLKGSGDFNQCQSNLKQIFTNNIFQWCINSTCPFDDLKKISVPFKDNEFVGLSEFWYSLNEIFRIESYVYNQFSEASEKYCKTSWLVTQDRHKRKLYPNADFKRLLYQCFKSSWISIMLHEGLKMPKSYTKFQPIEKINDEPVQWTLGALIYRTRFFPLRLIDNQHGVMVHHVMNISKTWSLEYIGFALCMVAVIFFIFIYIRRLHSMMAPSKSNTYSNSRNEYLESYPLCPSENRLHQPNETVFIKFKN